VSASSDGTVTWSELLEEARARLSAAGIDSAEADARWIVADCLGVGPGSLATPSSQLATERGVARFDELVRRRARGEPLQYVLRSWGFRTLDLMVDHRVLIPRPETEAVVEVALAVLDAMGGRERATRVVDLGTGSGAIALSIAVERVRTEVWATDASDAALEVARANLAGIGRPGARVRTVAGDWFAALPDELLGAVDLVVSNPPYVPDATVLAPEVADWEPAGALFSGPEGLDDLSRIITAAGPWLVDGGALVVELSPEQAEACAAMAERHFGEVRVAEDLAGRARALVARHPRR
jgi:release factor glutamine methyltransferase